MLRPYGNKRPKSSERYPFNFMELQHFLLTRFNILLWRQDKEGKKVRTTKWLEHRFSLFERYCLPSIKDQTCQDFEWIVLFDSMTPDCFKGRIACYQKDCPQLIPVFVEPENGWRFAEIFQKEITKRLKAKRVISTYLDNDDALNVIFVEDLQHRAATANNETFFYYDEGCQFYTEGKFIIQIHYPRNHFVSVVEEGNPATIKGIFGYGRHYYIDEIKGAKIEHVETEPMWCEVVHEKNMINDANFLIGTKLVRDEGVFRRKFAVDEDVRAGFGVYMFSFLPRYMKTFVRRAKHRLIGRQW